MLVTLNCKKNWYFSQINPMCSKKAVLESLIMRLNLEQNPVTFPRVCAIKKTQNQTEFLVNNYLVFPIVSK